jgi:hypothetical protein
VFRLVWAKAATERQSTSGTLESRQIAKTAIPTNWPTRLDHPGREMLQENAGWIDSGETQGL